MIHNKNHLILKQFLGDYKKELYGRKLEGKLPMSQKSIALALDELEKEGLLKSRKEGNIKYFCLNLDNTAIKDIIITSELAAKNNLFKKHRKIANLFKKDDRIVGIFGSYAKETQGKGSDIDVFIVGKKLKDDYDAEGKKFDLDISIKYFPEKEFENLLKSKNNLCREIIRNHVLIFGVEKFINTVWSYYYDLN